MFTLSDANRFFLYPFPTDMRKSFYSLSGIVTNSMGMDVRNGDAFIFVNRPCNSMKILHMECGGLVIYHMKLEQGTIRLPQIDDGDKNTAIATFWTDLMLMVQGINPSKVTRQKRWEYQEKNKKSNL